MFHITNSKSKYFLLLAMTLMVPYLFRTTSVWDSYWEEYYQSSNTGIDTIAFIFIFAALIARSSYVQKGLLGLASVWGLANLVPYSFSEWNNGNFESFLTIVLYVAGLGLLGKIVLSEEALPDLQIKGFVDRVKGSSHQIFSIVWLVLAALAGIAAAWVRYQQYSQTNLYTVVTVIAVFITTIAIFDFIHRFFEENSKELSIFTASLNDFSLNTYLTRRISSGVYAVVHTSILLFTAYYVPVAISSASGNFWINLIGFPLVLPVALFVAYLVITAVRLIMEYSNALIHVAENTSK